MSAAELPEAAIPMHAPHVPSPLRHAFGLALVVPLLALLGLRLSEFVSDPIFSAYAVTVIGCAGCVLYIAIRYYRDPSRGAPPLQHHPLVSCLIPVKNEEAIIERCVRSVLASDYPNLELIVVDDGSTDETPVLLERLRASHPSLQLITLPTSVGKKRALTVAAASARGDYFVFTDSDCTIAPDAVSTLIRTFAANPDVGALAGHARALNASRNVFTRMQDTWYDGQFSIWKAAESVFGSVTCISGPLAAFRREAIYNFFPAWANDRFLGKEFPFATDRQLTAYVLGAPFVGEELKSRFSSSPFVSARDYPCRRWRVEYVKAARAFTVVPWTLPRLIRQQVRWKKSFVRNLFFAGRFQWRRGLGPGLLFYARALFIVAAPVMAFRHLVWVPLGGGFFITLLYVGGILFKGSIWGLVYRLENPGCNRWVYRPLMSLLTAVVFSLLLPYSILTLRRGVWARG